MNDTWADLWTDGAEEREKRTQVTFGLDGVPFIGVESEESVIVTSKKEIQHFSLNTLPFGPAGPGRRVEPVKVVRDGSRREEGDGLRPGVQDRPDRAP